jgi:hypothetical protein
MLIEKDFPRPTPITFAVRELIAELKSGPLVLIWYDPKRGPQTMPIGDAVFGLTPRSTRCPASMKLPCS